MGIFSVLKKVSHPSVNTALTQVRLLFGPAGPLSPSCTSSPVLQHDPRSEMSSEPLFVLLHPRYSGNLRSTCLWASKITCLLSAVRFTKNSWHLDYRIVRKTDAPWPFPMHRFPSSFGGYTVSSNFLLLQTACCGYDHVSPRTFSCLRPCGHLQGLPVLHCCVWSALASPAAVLMNALLLAAEVLLPLLPWVPSTVFSCFDETVLFCLSCWLG